MSFLDEVALRSHKRVQADKQNVTVEQLKAWIKRKPPVKDFRAGIHKAGTVSLIAELKQASPSAGVIRIENDIPARITGYTSGGAGALSILTEEEYFHGSPQLLESARKQTTLPLLRKDFIVDSYQIEESRVLGADAILLIAALLPAGLLADFIQRALDTQLAPLVEVHDERDLERAINAHAKIIGVNNRDLRTLKVDMATNELLIPQIPKVGYTIISESGIRTPEDVRHCGKIGAHAVLVGETLMRQADAAAAVRTLVDAGKDIL
jgi:indole-3-glycerol phosphate synthase